MEFVSEGFFFRGACVFSFESSVCILQVFRLGILQDDVVAWALLRWEVGSGTFVRSKLVGAPGVSL